MQHTLIDIGDKVQATDPKTGKTVARPVLATIITEDDKHFVDLTITTDDGPASIIATTHHPFWSNDHQAWINAGDLKPGTTLRTLNSSHLRVTAVHPFDKRQRTHNLTVEGLHTYHVLARATPVLVHNSSGVCPHINLAGVPEDMRPYVENVVRSMDKYGTLPSGVRQGGTRRMPGIYGGEGLPPAPPKYYVETDILPTLPGSKRPASGRLVFG